jgi:hypothetical protein
MYSTLLCGCAKFHTMFDIFFVFVVICYVHVSDAYCLLCFINFNYSCIVLYCMDLIACCNPASVLTSSISSPDFTDNGSVKLCINVYH